MSGRPSTRLPRGLAERLAMVEFVAFDFDGVFTDNRVWVFEDGREAVCCARADGLGLSKLATEGVATVIISTEINPVVSARARKLRTRCIQACDDKVAAFRQECEAAGVSTANAAFVGNDINDLAVLAVAGVPIVVADAHPDILHRAVYQTITPGGRGAVREVCELIALARRASAPTRKQKR